MRLPSITVTASARMNAGNDSITSTTRITTSSTIPPANPAIAPITDPTTSARPATANAIVRSSRAASSRRARTSRPISSVPSG
jgi:hypothetical protein